MSKTQMLILALIGLITLILLLIVRPAMPVAASEPTPTPVPVNPTAEPSDLRCRLARGAGCSFSEPTVDIAVSGLAPKTHPAIGARGVPTYTLISATFSTEVDPGTITSRTFYVSQGGSRIDGSIDYIDVSRLAVFRPERPLIPNNTYTATLTTGVQDRSGQPLAQDLVWAFTTTPGPPVFGSDNSSAGASIPGSGMRIYFGDLHAHSGYSDGRGTPADAFATARANGLDFFALTDHAFMLTEEEWQDILAQANAATVKGAFVALQGFEFTHLYGHINVFNTETYVHRNDPRYSRLADFYAWLVDQPTVIAQFNHPTKNDFLDWNFNNFAYSAATDQKIVLRELTDAKQFFLSLDTGWHLGTLKNSDTHRADWGCCPLMGLVAARLTKEAILEALKTRRTFFVSPSDRNFALVMRANGSWMGSAIPKTAMVKFTINAYDPDPKGKSLRLNLYNNGVRVASTKLPSNDFYTWKPRVPAVLGHYYYVEAYYNGWLYPAYSSPIWVERPPVAEAGASQIVAPGMVVTLDGSLSSDRDGDALAYQWTQESGPVGNLLENYTARPTFTAPNTLGNMVFRLTVVDTGGLSDSDTTVVTVTDKPVLSITKNGPATAEPGELITYTLTVTNNGITAALGVIITDVVPSGATYVSGGTLMPDNIVSWTVPDLPAHDRVIKTFAVTTSGGLANVKYGASCAGCVPAVGGIIIFTNEQKSFLPIITRGY